MRASARISAWVTPAKHGAFHALATGRGLSCSKLLLLLIDCALTDNPSTDVDATATTREVASASQRITIRLRPEDAGAIARRAAHRSMKPATYLAVLVRAHAAANPPMPRSEIEELKRAVAALSAVGRNLNQLVQAAHRGHGVDAETRRLLTPIVGGVEKVRQAVKAHAAANLASWIQK